MEQMEKKTEKHEDSSPVIVWESLKTDSNSDGSSGGNTQIEKDKGAKIIPLFHHSRLESEATVVERTIQSGDLVQPLKIIIVSSGFGDHRASTGSGTIRCAA